jgi:acetylornithine deacetylase/succinyl-diaminopimelate desuccinylase-like protein
MLLLGHVDTVGTDGWLERWRGDEREDPFSCAVVDDHVWGRGTIANGGLAAALAALWVLRRAGLRPRGEVTLAGIADREANGPGTGSSAGMKALRGQLQDGDLARPGFAVYLEPTNLAVCTAQLGFLIACLTVRERNGHGGRGRVTPDHQAIVGALEQHAAVVAQSARHPLVGRPSLVVTGMEEHSSDTVGECVRLRVMRSVVPGERLDDVAAALERAADSAEHEVVFTYAAGRDHPLGARPFEISPRDAGVARLRGVVESVRPERGMIQGAPYWSELSFLTELGIPAVYFSAGDSADVRTTDERVAVDDFVDQVRILALAIAEHCGVVAEA